jgi:hypothetical protein
MNFEGIGSGLFQHVLEGAAAADDDDNNNNNYYYYYRIYV